MSSYRQTAPRAKAIDPATLEVLNNAFGTIADEMTLTIIRTAYSVVSKELMDFSAAICTPTGEMAAQGLGLLLHLGAIPEAMQAVRKEFGDTLEPGDVVILNDPYNGGTHLPDVIMVRPLFSRRRELLGYAVLITHHSDMGGQVPGSRMTGCTEIFQEGLRIPPLKLYSRGELNTTLMRMIESNVRTPVEVAGDLRAQYAACYRAEQGLMELADRYGADELRAYMDELLEYGERLARTQIAAFPEGVYRFVDHLDDDGAPSGEPVRIVLTLTVKGGRVTADFTGTAPQVKSGINANRGAVASGVFWGVRAMIAAEVPENSGYQRTIEVVTQPGTVVHPLFPAPVAARGIMCHRIAEMTVGALAQATPERAWAAGEGGPSGATIGGFSPAGEPFLFADIMGGGTGARATRDGVEGIFTPTSNARNVSIEILEAEQPVMVNRYGFMLDTAGPGRHRGANALVREWRFLGERGMLSIRGDRKRFRPWGLAGGSAGAPSSNVLNPGTDGETIVPMKLVRELRRGDVIRHQQAGGGGYGDPLERDPALVARDVRDERISPSCAHREYGVVLDASGRGVAEAETAELRARLRALRRPDGAGTAGQG